MRKFTCPSCAGQLYFENFACERCGSPVEFNPLTQDFERLADQALLAKPIVKRRVAELADTLLTVLAKTDTDHPVTKAVGALIHERCETTRKSFRGR